MTSGRGELRRILGPLAGAAVCVGMAVGAGILRTPGEVAAALPSAPWILGVWLLGALLLLLVLQDQPHGIRTGRADLQAVLHGVLQSREGVPLQEPQHLDELPRSHPAQFGFQASAEDAETDWQIPVFQRAGMVEASRLSLQQRQIVHRVEEELLLAPVSPMSRDQLIREDQPHLIDRRHDRDLAVGKLRRHRVTVPVKPDQ
jgi:hypothetical protein